MDVVRVSLPLMLTVSLALHGGVATGMALRHFHSLTPTAQVAPFTPATTLILLTSESTPDLHQPAASTATMAHSVAASRATPFPSPPPPTAKSISTPTTIPPASLALEANPNAHIRSVPSASVLSPNPAPHLNGHDGVVFILDISGSMYEPFAGSTRLAFAREVLSRQIRELKDGTPFAITVYAQTARNSGPLVAASNATREAAIRFIREDFDCGGGTDLPTGLASAMKLGMGNLVLVSDGDLNTTLATLIDKARSILNPANHGPALTVVGISPRPDSDAVSLLHSLADQTGGRYSEAWLQKEEWLSASRSTSSTP